MNLKRNLILIGTGIIALIIISLPVKWPLSIISKQHNLGVESKETIPHNLNADSNLPSAPDVNTGSEAKPKMVKFPDEGIPVLMYHSISTIPGNSLGVPVKQFTEEMEWLHKQNYHSLSIDEFYQALANKAPVPEKPIVLTFDDGYSDNYSAAFPIIHQYGFRATFFIITSSVGPKMMTWDQLNELTRQGNSIGSHTVHHLDLSTLTAKQQENELSISKQELEKHLSITIQAFCFPSGRYNQTTLQLMPKLGYKLGFTTQPGKVHLGDDLMTLKRVRISGGMSLASFSKVVSLTILRRSVKPAYPIYPVCNHQDLY